MRLCSGKLSSERVSQWDNTAVWGRSMYPITPQKLGPGIVIGSERIITSNSAPTGSSRHGIRDAFFPECQQ